MTGQERHTVRFQREGFCAETSFKKGAGLVQLPPHSLFGGGVTKNPIFAKAATQHCRVGSFSGVAGSAW